MIRRIDPKDAKWYDEEGFFVGYETKNPLFQTLPQYHFDRDEMCEVFDAEFMEWFWNHINEYGDEFFLTHYGDEFYIIHFPSGTIVNWYKHMGRTNTCNKDLTLDDLREFKKMLLEDFSFEEVETNESN